MFVCGVGGGIWQKKKKKKSIEYMARLQGSHLLESTGTTHTHTRARTHTHMRVLFSDVVMVMIRHQYISLQTRPPVSSTIPFQPPCILPFFSNSPSDHATFPQKTSDDFSFSLQK